MHFAVEVLHVTHKINLQYYESSYTYEGPFLKYQLLCHQFNFSSFEFYFTQFKNPITPRSAKKQLIVFAPLSLSLSSSKQILDSFSFQGIGGGTTTHDVLLLPPAYTMYV